MGAEGEQPGVPTSAHDRAQKVSTGWCRIMLTVLHERCVQVCTRECTGIGTTLCYRGAQSNAYDKQLSLIKAEKVRARVWDDL